MIKYLSSIMIFLSILLSGCSQDIATLKPPFDKTNVIFSGETISAKDCNYDSDSIPLSTCYQVKIDSTIYNNLGIDFQQNDTIVVRVGGSSRVDYSHGVLFTNVDYSGICFLIKVDDLHFIPSTSSTIIFSKRYQYFEKKGVSTQGKVVYASGLKEFYSEEELNVYLESVLKK